MGLTKKVEVIIGGRHFQIPPKLAEALILVLSGTTDEKEEDNEGSIPASEVFPELLDEKKRPGIVLRGLRERDGLKQEALASKIERPQSWISQMETGSRPIGPKMAALLAKVFKVNPNVFSSKPI